MCMNFIRITKNHYLIVLSVALFGFSSFISKKYDKPVIFISKQEGSLNFNDKLLASYNLGLKRLISSTIWISTILESDIDHYKNKDLNSWMFLRFNTISNIEPLFYENYIFGGTYLSIIKDDLDGASTIYDKGLSYYGDDYALLRDAGFHYYFEVENYTRAFQIYSRLKNHPKASPLVLSALARLQRAEGNADEAYQLLLNKYNQFPNKGSFLPMKIGAQLYSLKAERDLKCLNEGKKNCETTDFYGNNYVKKSGSWEAVQAWEPLNIKRNKNKKSKN